MARPTKQGVDYFPLDVHLDDKFKFIEIKYGTKGFGIIIKLIQKIYSCGYWYKWTDDEKLLFTGGLHGVDINEVNEVINEAIDRGIFNKEIHDQFQVLTSKGIQKRYSEIVKRRKDIELVKEYMVIVDNFGVNEVIKSINVNIDDTSCEHNVCKSTQKKRKETKVKETKVKETSIAEVIDYESIKTYFNAIVRNTKLSQIRDMTDTRKKHVKKRIDESGIDSLRTVFKKAVESDFLSGRNGKWTNCGFDWLINKSNFIKVLEGNYDNKYQRTSKHLTGLDDVEVGI